MQDEEAVLERRQAELETFYKGLLPALEFACSSVGPIKMVAHAHDGAQARQRRQIFIGAACGCAGRHRS